MGMVREKAFFQDYGKMLQKDIPVILCIPQMVLPKEKKDSLAFIPKSRALSVFKKSASVTTLCCGDRVDY